MAAGSIIIDLLLRTGNFSTDTQRAAKDLERLKKEAYDAGRAIGDSFKDAGNAVKNLAGALGIGLSIGGLIGLVKGAIDAADHLNDLSKKTGIAVDTLGGMGFAAGQAGGDLETVTAAAGKLNKTIAEAAAGNKEASEFFKVLGISVKDAAGQTKTADVVFAEVADKFAGFADGPEKAALALRGFGKAGADIIPLLNDGGDALRDNIAYYKKYAGVTTETANQADQFNDTLGKLHLLSTAFGKTLASELLPPLQAVADMILKAKENSETMKDVVGVAIEALKDLAITGAFVALTFEAAGNRIGAFAAQLGILISAASRAQDRKSITDPFGSRALIDELGSAIPQLKAVGDAAQQEGERIRKNFADFRLAINTGFTPSLSGKRFDATTDPRSTLFGKEPAKPPAPGLAAHGGGANAAAREAAAEAKKILEGQLKDFKDYTQEQVQLYDFAAKYTRGYYEDGLQSLTDFNANTRALREAALANQLAGFDKEIAALQAFKATQAKGSERQDADNKIADAQNKRADAVRKAAQDSLLSLQEEKRAALQLQNQYDDLRATLLQLAGDEAGAAAIRRKQSVDAARVLIGKQPGGDPALAAQLDRQLKGQDDLRQAQTDYNRLLDRSSNAQELIGLTAQESGASELDTMEKIHKSRQTSLDELSKMVDRANELALALGTPDAIQFAEKLGIAFKKATAEVDPLLVKIRDVGKEMGETIANSLEDAILSGKGLKATLGDLDKEIQRILLRNLVTKPLGDWLSNALGGNGQASGGGGLLGSLFSGITGGGGANAGSFNPNGGFGGLLSTIFGKSGTTGNNPSAYVAGAGASGGGVWDSILSWFGGAFASGGTLGAGKWGVAGENGAEWVKGPASIVPITAGTRMPAAANDSSSHRNVVSNVYITVPGNTDKRTATQIAGAAGRGVADAVRRVN